MRIDRSLRYGGYAALTTALVIALAVGVNLLVERLPWRADMTAEGFFSLSDQTRKVLAASDASITVLELWEAGREDPKVVELLHRYQVESRRLQIRAVDPYRNPVELERYTVNGAPPAVGSLILEAGGRFKILRVADLYEMRYDEQTGEEVPTAFIAESAITNAIASVTATRDPVVCILRGHGEKDLPPAIAERLARAFYVVRDLTLAVGGEVPDEADIVVAVSPRQDLQPKEAEALRRFLRERGGKLFVMTDLGADPQPNLGALLEGFGLALRPWLVVERASDHHLPNQPYVLIPSVGSHPITDANASADLPILFPLAQVIERLPAVRRTVSLQPLLASSNRAYAKVDLEDSSGDQGPKDPTGPFVLAVAVTDTGEAGERASRMVVMGSSHYLYPSEGMGRLLENDDLFMNCLGWLQDRPELISIPARTISGTRYDINLSQLQFFLFAGITVLAIPLAVFLAGFVTWLRRRHR